MNDVDPLAQYRRRRPRTLWEIARAVDRAEADVLRILSRLGLKPTARRYGTIPAYPPGVVERVQDELALINAGTEIIALVMGGRK